MQSFRAPTKWIPSSSTNTDDAKETARFAEQILQRALEHDKKRADIRKLEADAKQAAAREAEVKRQARIAELQAAELLARSKQLRGRARSRPRTKTRRPSKHENENENPIEE